MTEMKDVKRVIEHPILFKNKLGIGEDAFAALKKKKLAGKVVKILDAAGAFGVGAAVAALPPVAAIFFAWKGLLAALGIGGAAVGIGGAAVVPKWINTPLDALAVVLFDFFALLGIKVAVLDGGMTDSERRVITEYFVREWGYSEQFVQLALPKLECNVEIFPIVELVDNLIEFEKCNPDCNYKAMSKELTGFLKEVTRADGELHDLEVIFIQWLEITLTRGKPGFWNELLSAVGFNHKAKKKAEGEGESAPNPVSDGGASDGGGDQGDVDGDGSFRDGHAPDSTLIVRNFRTALRWTKGRF